MISDDDDGNPRSKRARIETKGVREAEKKEVTTEKKAKNSSKTTAKADRKTKTSAKAEKKRPKEKDGGIYRVFSPSTL